MLINAQTVSGPLLQQLSERIERQTGLHFPGERFGDLERGLAQAARELGCRDARTYAESLLSRDFHASDLEALSGSLTVGETHFFRDPGVFAFLESTLLPGLIAARRSGDRRLRIWSAGCASGEEPYSIAILLHRLLPDLSDWQITILGTDINPKILARATAGAYSEWSFRDTPAWVKPRYFTTSSGKRYEIQPWIQRMVRFACLNLAEDVYPSVLNNTNALDLIICRNVLLYFAAARIPPVVQRFHRALADGGQLLMGAVEASLMTFPGLTPVPAPGVSLYRKEHAAQSAECGWKTIEPTARALEPAGGRGQAAGVSSTTPPIQAAAVAHAPSAVPPVFPVPSVPPGDQERPPYEFLSRRDHSAPEKPPAEAALAAAGGDKRAEAQSLYAAGRYYDARAALLGSAGPRPDNDPQLAGLLAQCHANLGELAEALLWCERALGMAKTDPVLHFLRAGILQELQRDDEALLALRSVLFLDAGHVLAHFSMANLHRRANRMSVAARHIANIHKLLAHRDQSEELPQSGGLTVGRLNAILAATAGPVDEQEYNTQ